MKYIFSVILFFTLVSAGTVSGQKKKAERAYEFYKSGEYYEAIDQFKNTYSKTKDKALKAEMVFMVSECYRMINDPKNAETWYKLAVKSSFSKPEAEFYLAESLKKNGKYQA